MSLGELFTGAKKKADGTYDSRFKDTGSAKMFDAAGSVVSWPLKLMWYVVGMMLWFISNAWGNLILGLIMGHSAFGKYFGWIEPSAEPTAREIALGGSFDWRSFGIGLAFLIVGIIRLVGREVVVRKSEN